MLVKNNKILIIGEVYTDYYLRDEDNLVRLGGIFHSARACDAMKIKYALAYYAPKYLCKDIKKYSLKLHASISYEMGFVDNAPNVMVVNDIKEIAKQEYNNILCKQAKVIETANIDTVIKQFKPTDILIYPGKYDIVHVLNCLKKYDVRVHIDFHYESETFLSEIPFLIDTAIISTSSDLFLTKCQASFDNLKEIFNNQLCKKILFKENRGGSQLFVWKNKKLYEAPAYNLLTIKHSVGVGDCFNSVYVGLSIHYLERKLKLAAIVASLYASTLEHDNFIEHVNSSDLEKLIEIKGIRVPWCKRKGINIYLAAPDFKGVDTKLLDELNYVLEKHNFNVHLPIRENGLIKPNSDKLLRLKTYHKDICLIDKCQLVVGVLLYNDPGTLVELGIFKQAGKPVIIFDPYNLCTNMFVQESADYICCTIEKVLESVFECCSKIKGE